MRKSLLQDIWDFLHSKITGHKKIYSLYILFINSLYIIHCMRAPWTVRATKLRCRLRSQQRCIRQRMAEQKERRNAAHWREIAASINSDSPASRLHVMGDSKHLIYWLSLLLSAITWVAINLFRNKFSDIQRVLIIFQDWYR